MLDKPGSAGEAAQVEQTAEKMGELGTGWSEGFWMWLAAAGMPLVTGPVHHGACSAALVGYPAVVLLRRDGRR